jgi:hypothetical protein
MPFSSNEKTEKGDKLSLQLTGSANDAPGKKFWYSEDKYWAPIVPPDKLWNSFSSIPGAGTPAEADTAVTNNPTILEKRKIRLTLDLTSNNRQFVARSTYSDNTSAIYENWIQPSLIRDNGQASAGYIIRLYHGDPDAAGVEITTIFNAGADGAPCWEWFYQTGILSISTDEAATFGAFYSTNGLWVEGYRYIGATGGSGFGSGSLTVQEEGVIVDPAAGTLNFIGDGITASSGGSGVVNVSISGVAGTFTNPNPTPYTVGGISAGSTFPSGTALTDMWEQLLYPYVAPAVSLGLTPGAGVREYGDTVSGVLYTATTTKNSNNITSVEYFLNAGSLFSEPAPIATGGVETYNYSGVISDTATLRVDVGDGTQTTSDSETYTFVYPFYVGELATATPNEAQVKSLTKQIKTQSNTTYSHNPTVERFIIAFPASYGTLSTIYDPNSFDITADFTAFTDTYTMLDSNNVLYRIYVYNNLTTQTNFSVSYRF